MSDLTDNLADDWMVDWRFKGFPPSADGIAASCVADQRWDVLRDFTTPIAVLKEDALEHNLARMSAYCATHGVRIAPHGKTTMSPELMRAQLDRGAWGMTAATVWQVRAMTQFGARRVILANECVDPAGLRWIGTHLSRAGEAEVLVFADSVAAVEAMRSVLDELEVPRPLPVLIEVGVAGGRAGARDQQNAVAAGRAVAAAPTLELAGVAGFEGVVAGARAEATERVRGFVRHLRRTAEALMAESAFRHGRPVILSAGGSIYFDQVVDVLTTDRDRYRQPVEVVLRSGCYLTHDHGTYGQNSPFADGPERDFSPALEVWARVVSTPEPGLAIIDAGKRDMSTDGLMPVVLERVRDGRHEQLPGAVVDHCNDQHGYLHLPDPDTVRVGDLVALGISHPCTTFDKWRAVPVVDDSYRVTSVVRTYF